MDLASSLTGGGVVATVIAVGLIVYKAVNHKRIRSTCCGKKFEVSVDVEETTPPALKVDAPAKPE